MVLVMLAAISVSLPYIYQSTSIVLKKRASLRSTAIAYSANLTAADFVNQMTKAGLLTFSNDPTLVTPQSVPGATANWSFAPADGVDPPTLHLYTCDPRGIETSADLPHEQTDCEGQGWAIETLIKFLPLEMDCTVASAVVESEVKTGSKSVVKAIWIKFPTGDVNSGIPFPPC